MKITDAMLIGNSEVFGTWKKFAPSTLQQGPDLSQISEELYILDGKSR